MKIDYNRGVMKRHHQTGVEVYMYLDTPGVYLNAFEMPVSEKLAKEAGYDVEKLGKDKLRRERMATAAALIEQELADENDMERKVEVEVNGLRLVNIGKDRFVVEDPDGARLTPVPLTHAMAQGVFEAMTKGVAPEVPKVGAEKANEAPNKRLENPNKAAKFAKEPAPEKAGEDA